MTAQSTPPRNSSSAFDNAARTLQAIAETLRDRLNTVGDTFIDLIYPAIEQATRLVGTTIAPVADIPFIKFATGIPGVSWLLAAIGQVNAEKVEKSVAQLRAKYPLKSDAEMVQQVIAETAFQAAQVGLLTNLVPPAAVFLFALDIGAISALQAEMIYKIAAIYGFSTEDAARRGEVLAIWAVFTGSSGTLKSGLSFLEILPGIGTAIGITSDAAIVYGVGFLASRYYEVKLSRKSIL